MTSHEKFTIKIHQHNLVTFKLFVIWLVFDQNSQLKVLCTFKIAYSRSSVPKVSFSIVIDYNLQQSVREYGQSDLFNGRNNHSVRVEPYIAKSIQKFARSAILLKHTTIKDNPSAFYFEYKNHIESLHQPGHTLSAKTKLKQRRFCRSSTSGKRRRKNDQIRLLHTLLPQASKIYKTRNQILTNTKYQVQCKSQVFVQNFKCRLVNVFRLSPKNFL